MTYDPKSAVKSVMQSLKADIPKPIGGLTNASGELYQVKQRPETLCFFLLEWLGGGLNLPADFEGLPTSSKSLRTHQRPDGGIYVGLYSGGEQGDDVVVYGDPLMEQREAIQAVHAFRRFHAERQAGMPVRSGLVS